MKTREFPLLAKSMTAAATLRYAFDLTADMGVDDHFSLIRQDSVRLGLKFVAALAQPSPTPNFKT